MIDNIGGFSLNLVNKNEEYSGTIQMKAISNVFYGETESPDCPLDGGFCFEEEKMAVMASISQF